ncbi:MAG: PEGA domain-containing protein [Gammaproteobacteria bacterium]|nr:PEGA domain-containing protein [Gammaproteobacteria bacterium]
MADTPLTLPLVTLQPADALITLRSNPAGVAVTVDGTYQGTTPVEVNIRPGRAHAIRLSKSGFAPLTRTVTLAATEERTLDLTLDPLIGTVLIKAEPSDAEVWVDGASRGQQRTLQLPARAHRIEVRKAGYAPFTTEINPQPNITQELAVNLLTEAAARLAALIARIKDPTGGELLLFDGGDVVMGASRREPGRRANEVLRTATITRLFYLGVTR